MKHALAVDKGVFHVGTAEVDTYGVFTFLHRHALSTQIGELNAHCWSRWRTLT